MTNDLTPPSGTIVVFSDIWCSFAHVAVHRLHAARRALGLVDEVAFDHRAFPLELLNHAPSPRSGTDSEVGGIASLEPDAGWQMWRSPDWLYPSTTLPALEAVQAAKEQGLRASEGLDLALRRAFWAESRCIANRAVILEAAATADGVDPDHIAAALDDGRARRTLSEQARVSATDRVNCSPHLFLPDGSDHANPGIDVGWAGDYGTGWPVVASDDPDVYRDLLRRAVS
ncbi:putative DsbA family dithiol-disulfide isomerase [Lipingzhangella halophila]|uniref:Putative DsbA family dithiol-disulfide isomerase n=1 Tax=Lipingzhangella halophila TaxID=1783352 RepID=A0A7W7RKX8_9ACTN|nr:DsbA family protein [Lipingzhangella halophila]MBB4933888.1 putative DsbA family dithiol-disulfide isomerase [Lipingzhangella halophila]